MTTESQNSHDARLSILHRHVRWERTCFGVSAVLLVVHFITAGFFGPIEPGTVGRRNWQCLIYETADGHYVLSDIDRQQGAVGALMATVHKYPSKDGVWLVGRADLSVSVYWYFRDPPEGWPDPLEDEAIMREVTRLCEIETGDDLYLAALGGASSQSLGVLWHNVFFQFVFHGTMAGFLLLFVLANILSVAAFRKKRHLHLCDECGYDLVSLPSNKCPECGHVQTEKT